MEPILRLSVTLVTAFFFLACEDDSYEGDYYGTDAYYSETSLNGEQYEDYGENPYYNVADNPVSTFSIDADGGSYTNMRRYLYLGQTPPAASVRVEEFINYFTFDYEEPAGDENIALNSELATCPWNSAHHLLRLGIKGKTIPENDLPNSNYVFLIDVSGSMTAADKLGILKVGFKTLTDNLRDQDKMAIVTYAGSARVLLNSTYGDEKDKIKAAIDQLEPGGSTAGAQGIITAYEIAEENFIPDGNNRIIIGSDGDFNVGISDKDELVELIEEKRESGVYLTVLGVGSGNLNDRMMEQLANKGNGNYEYIDNAQQVNKLFCHELGKFYTIAKDSKIQITFNENAVDSFRLIGYENRVMEDDDFDNDSADAGEIGSGQTITAVYELQLKDNAQGECGTFDFRYKKPNEDLSRLISHSIDSNTKTIDQSSENMRFVSSVAGLGLILKDSKYKGSVDKAMVIDLAENAMNFDPHDYREEYLELIENWSEK